MLSDYLFFPFLLLCLEIPFTTPIASTHPFWSISSYSNHPKYCMRTQRPRTSIIAALLALEKSKYGSHIVRLSLSHLRPSRTLTRPPVIAHGGDAI
ncbi:uncharacterized protein ASPGLDRAFT_476710 [Aspergillus glaucus CBS 516.65]|uniref:Secreted protein n=1 Tax=Aspergillus glaucus CBS 516.65 TaxID=1160497 RepID=A0A1L9VHC4_ASPGL|nr:hypothetical protein ASPGLDRAFT_476710 [Aspergillus glaucus CBS 516.65]OJJ83265.1 hypothetical protein ASPGLDRAFT_476710 [Aspergillus glaucus CBS 516.65]